MRLFFLIRAKLQLLGGSDLNKNSSQGTETNLERRQRGADGGKINLHVTARDLLRIITRKKCILKISHTLPTPLPGYVCYLGLSI
jgi:hypothetical protein